MNQTRCISLDWFEVFAIEPNEGGDMPFFVRNGFFIDNRGYGTRIYHEMFTLIGSDGNPLLEIRRRPKNPLMPAGSCHIRLVNATCYRENAADIMRQFLNQYGYTFCNVSRADICLDFVLFDDNTRPRVFMQRYMRESSLRSTKPTFTRTVPIDGRDVYGIRLVGVRHHHPFPQSSITRHWSSTTLLRIHSVSHTFDLPG